jgi:hypothetical protein
MVDITKAQPHVLRIAVVAICVLVLFVFFDPIGFASTPPSKLGVPGTTSYVTHIVLYQFKKDADPAAIELVCSDPCNMLQSVLQRKVSADYLGDPSAPSAQACAKMLSLKENCLAPNSNYPYIKRIKGGKDHSNEGLQVGILSPDAVH